MEVSFKAKPISIKTAENINQQLKKSKFFDIICHSSTDEDAAACAKALQWHLKTLKIPSQIISDSAVDNDCYRISIHSKNNSVIDFFNYVKNNTNPDLTAGGHPNRGGGCIQTLNPKKCHIWVEQFIKSTKELYK